MSRKANRTKETHEDELAETTRAGWFPLTNEARDRHETSESQHKQKNVTNENSLNERERKNRESNHKQFLSQKPPRSHTPEIASAEPRDCRRLPTSNVSGDIHLRCRC